MTTSPTDRPERGLVPGLVLLTTVTSVVSSLGAPLVPDIARSADVSITAAQWSLTLTMLVAAVSTPLLGRIGSSHARRAVIGGLLVVATGLLMCALPLGFALLLAGRALQGFGIALIPLAIAIARDCLPPRRVVATIALLSVTTVAGSGLGYPLTAVAARHAGIAGAFWLGFGLCCATLVVALRTLPATSEQQHRPLTLDGPGAVLLAVGTSGVLLAVNRGETWGWLSWETTGLIIASAVALVLWTARTLRIEHPLVDLHLAWGPSALGANLTAVCAGVAVYMLLSLIMIAVQAPSENGFGLARGVVSAGVLLVPYSVLNLAGSRLAVHLGRRMRIDLVLPIGCALYGVAAATLMVFHQDFWQLMLGMALAGLGGGATFAVMPALLLRGLPHAETGSAVAFNMVLRFLGFATGSALTPALIDVFAGGAPPTHATFTGVAAVGVGLWALAVLIAGVSAVFANRPARTDTKLGLTDPIYSQTSGSVRVVLSSADALPEDVRANLPKAARKVLDTLRLEGRPLSTGQIAELARVRRPIASLHLQSLRELGLVAWEGQCPKTHASFPVDPYSSQPSRSDTRE